MIAISAGVVTRGEEGDLMAEQKQHQEDQQQNKPFSFPAPVSNALLASGSISLLSYAFGVPQEHILRVACAAGGLSFAAQLYRNFQEAADSHPRKAKGRQVTHNSANGSRQVRLDYEMYQPTHIARETWREALKRKLVPQRSLAQPAEMKKPDAPQSLNEMVFRSRHDGAQVELLESFVIKMTRAAYLNRGKGRGLGVRFWVRECNSRPNWYQEIGPVGYWAYLNLLKNAERVFGRQLVVKQAHQQYGLLYNDHNTYRYLAYAEWVKRHNFRISEKALDKGIDT
jgi:hypothetical protein